VTLMANKEFLRVFMGHGVQWGCCYPVHLTFYGFSIVSFNQKTVNILLHAGECVSEVCEISVSVAL